MEKPTTEETVLLKAILDSAVDGIITIDIKGIIQTVNPAVTMIFGYSENELEGKNISMLMPQPHSEFHDEYITRYLESRIPTIIGIGREVEGLKKNGEVFPFWLSVSEVHMKDKTVFTGIVHDISDLKEAENRLKELNEKLERRVEQRTNRIAEVVNKLLETNKNLEIEISERKKIEESLNSSKKKLKIALSKEKELNELKSRFVTLASHEFRTPLSNILSSASLIDKYNSKELAERRSKHVEKIKNSARNLNNILNDFLSLSKIEEGKTSLHLEEFDLIDLCRKEVENMKEYLKKGQTINIKSTPKPLKVKLDKHLLSNVLINLLSNASKYSPLDNPINFEIIKNENSFSIKITDKGIGIPKNDKPYMFDRFFRASNAANIEGTGLGLNIVKNYVELMDGKISFESEVGKGSVFIVNLPINR